jgi:hypothetical protein
MNMWRVGEDMGSKEMDRCPLTHPFPYFPYPLPLSTCAYVFPLLTSVLSSRTVPIANDF